jgi:phage tail sheath protein FI
VAAALAWSSRLTALGVIADGFGAMSPLSYAAMWHPWISTCIGLTGGRPLLRDAPPDGAIAGMLAAREASRGVWVAPAGVPLRGVVRLASLTALTTDDRVRLFDAHANLVDQRPGVFTTLSAHTLSGDPRLLQVSVRRLLILLRKVCLRLGARYMFEVNNNRFRQLVRMRFDRILTSLTDRGALHAFRVNTSEGLNTAEDQDAGRFIVSLQIAPTSPVEFITVTLLRSGEGLLDVVEG